MVTVAAGHDAAFRAHAPDPDHPERPERSDAALAAIERLGHRIGRYAVVPATRAQVERVHHPRYVDEIARTATLAEGERLRFDEDTVADRHTYATALLAAGAAVAAVDAVLGGRATRAFALGRPPGHHAEVDRPMGFCFFDSVAIAAEHAIVALASSRVGRERVAIVDWDVHHGNGTQRAFDGRADVLFVSSHQPKLFPTTTGQPSERGRGAGLGFTINLPLAHDASDDDLLRLHQRITAPILEAFRPDLLLVSAGFDAHVDDRAGEQRITARGFGRLAALLFDVADRVCAGRAVLVLEGGYALDGLTDSIAHVLEAALDPAPYLADPIAPAAGAGAALLDALADLHSPSWPVLREGTAVLTG